MKATSIIRVTCLTWFEIDPGLTEFILLGRLNRNELRH
jgi:hypothetical protein